MGDSTLTPDDDRLLERLAAAGPVLDQLGAEAAERAAGPVPGDRRGLRHPSRRRRTHRTRGRALAAAVVLVVLVTGAIGLFVLGRDDRQAVTTDQPTTTTQVEPDPALAALVEERVDGMETCGPAPTEADWPRPWPEGWKQVNSPDCTNGWVDADAEAVQPIAVYADAERGDPIAYWSPSTGWIPLDEWQDPAFDLARYRAAYQAELAAREEPGDG